MNEILEALLSENLEKLRRGLFHPILYASDGETITTVEFESLPDTHEERVLLLFLRGETLRRKLKKLQWLIFMTTAEARIPLTAEPRNCFVVSFKSQEERRLLLFWIDETDDGIIVSEEKNVEVMQDTLLDAVWEGFAFANAICSTKNNPRCH